MATSSKTEDVDFESQTSQYHKSNGARILEVFDLIIDVVALCCWIMMIYTIFVVWCWAVELKNQL